MKVLNLGLREYGEVLAIQEEIRCQIRLGASDDVIILVEHPSVATLGRRGSEDEIFDKTLPIHTIDRGGKATLHGPGQLVIYPLVHLGEGNRDVRAWVRHLEQFVHDLCKQFGIETETNEELPGVWTVKTHRKIASIGISIREWISMHGIAINVTLDPKEFERIDPCGLGASVMTNVIREAGAGTMQSAMAWAEAHAVAHFSQFQKAGAAVARRQSHYN